MRTWKLGTAGGVCCITMPPLEGSAGPAMLAGGSLSDLFFVVDWTEDDIGLVLRLFVCQIMLNLTSVCV